MGAARCVIEHQSTTLRADYLSCCRAMQGAQVKSPWGVKKRDIAGMPGAPAASAAAISSSKSICSISGLSKYSSGIDVGVFGAM